MFKLQIQTINKIKKINRLFPLLPHSPTNGPIGGGRQFCRGGRGTREKRRRTTVRQVEEGDTREKALEENERVGDTSMVGVRFQNI